MTDGLITSPFLKYHSMNNCIELRGKRGKGPKYFDSPLLSDLDEEREGASKGAATSQLQDGQSELLMRGSSSAAYFI